MSGAECGLWGLAPDTGIWESETEIWWVSDERSFWDTLVWQVVRMDDLQSYKQDIGIHLLIRKGNVIMSCFVT